MFKFVIVICFSVLFHGLKADTLLETDNIIVSVNENAKDQVTAEARHSANSFLIAKATMTFHGNSTGWNFLDVWTREGYPNELTAYYAGYCEGRVSTNLIAQFWHNTISTLCLKIEKTCDEIRDFIEENDSWINETIKSKKHLNSYWWQMNLVHRQLEGLYKGYKEGKKRSHPDLTYNDFLFLNLQGDMMDLFKKFGPKDFNPTNHMLNNGHCSAIVKVLPNRDDLYVAHTTWNGYNTMIRVVKRYQLNFKRWHGSKLLIPGSTITFTSYPGLLISGDDFFITSANLAIQETTTGNFNKDLWQYVHAKGNVFSFYRVQVANRLATSGKTWCEEFAKLNSGTYNNQWMIVDYNRFEKGKQLQLGLLWVLEQIPGYIEMHDQTHVLLNKSYWPSYNIPYYKDIFQRSGYQKLVKKYGSWISYKGAPRARIMKRDHSLIDCPCTMLSFIRSNNYKHDPLSKCKCRPPYSAANAIAARNDLNPRNGTYQFPELGHAAFGAIDAKFVNSDLIRIQSFVGAAGPTTGTKLPPFKWSASDFKDTVLHLGQPDKFHFKPNNISFHHKKFNEYATPLICT